jgi:NAD(P)-dependent dehydrogenase (short-subunit alcohol dehydrogenase family)
MPTNKKNHGTVLITGASSGIGRELAGVRRTSDDARFGGQEAGPA